MGINRQLTKEIQMIKGLEMFSLAGNQKCPLLVVGMWKRTTNSCVIGEIVKWYFVSEGQFDNIYCLRRTFFKSHKYTFRSLF